MLTVRRLSDPGLDTRDIEIITDVTDDGWHVVSVPEQKNAAAGSGVRHSTPGWAYSVGLYASYGHPEVLVFGLEDTVTAALVDAIGNLVRSGRRFEVGSPQSGILEAVECLFRPVHRDWYEPFLGDSEWYYCGGSFPVNQCFWPDAKGRAPWEDGLDPAFEKLQPLLFRQGLEASRAKALLESIDVPV